MALCIILNCCKSTIELTLYNRNARVISWYVKSEWHVIWACLKMRNGKASRVKKRLPKNVENTGEETCE